MQTKHQKQTRIKEYARLLEECTDAETKIIVDTVKALKNSLKDFDR